MKIIKKALKGAAKYGFAYFLALYLGVGGYAVCDYKLNHSHNIKEKTKNTFLVKNYNISLEDKIKKLTIVGEKHIYNDKDSEFAKDLIKDFDYVAHEGSSNNSVDFLTWITAKTYIPVLAFYNLGSGRAFKNPTIYRLSLRNGKTIHFLEQGEDEFKKKSTLGQRLGTLGYGIVSFAIAPIAYIDGKRELSQGFVNEMGEFGNYIANMSKRDAIMADNILKVLEDDKIDSLLCVVGEAHVYGIIKNLKEKTKVMDPIY